MLARARRDTPHRSTTPRVVEDTIVSLVDELLAGRADDIAAVGIGAAGFVATDRATVVFAPHLSWRNEPLREALGKRVSLPIFVDNDANAAVWAEHRFGAGRGESHLVMVNLGTGIGGGIVLGGRRHPRALRHRRRVRAHAGGARRHPLRVRQQGLLGAVRLAATRWCARPAG